MTGPTPIRRHKNQVGAHHCALANKGLIASVFKTVVVGARSRRGSTSRMEAVPGMNGEVGLALQAWGIGLLTTALVVLPGMTALQGISADPFPQSLLPRLEAFLVMMLPGLLMTFTFGVVLSFPIFVLGLLTALVFRQRIARHPLFFAGLAPLVTIGLVAVVTVLSRDAEARALLSSLQEVLAVALRGDSLIFAIPVAAGSFYYCLSLGGLERSADRE